MTLGECIRRADALRPNSATEEEKARWVLELEGELETAFLPRYDVPLREGARRWPEDRTKELLGSGPFEEMYTFQVLSRLELMDQEWDACNAHSLMVRQLESAFKKEFHRTHQTRPSGGVRL